MVADWIASRGVNPGLRVKLDFAVQAVAKHRLVRAGHNGYSGPVQCSNCGECFCKKRFAYRGIGAGRA